MDDQAGSNLSFQHMVSSSKWRLHNNQTSVFGDVVAQRWTHLVTVFDDGDIRQYMDGVLVNTNIYPNGSFNNIDLYKLGVNRAGNSYFEGMIDEVMCGMLRSRTRTSRHCAGPSSITAPLFGCWHRSRHT